MKKIILSQKLTAQIKAVCNEDPQLMSLMIYLTAQDHDGNYEFHKAETPSFITVREDGMISYMPIGKHQEFSDDESRKWLLKNRQACRASRLPQLVLGKYAMENVTAQHIEKFSSAFAVSVSKSEDHKKYKVCTVDGDDIVKYYDFTKYAQPENNSSLWNSCMRDKDESLFQLYAGSKNCRMLIVKLKVDPYSNNEIYGRALLWNTTDGEQFMDRIYSYDEDAITILKQHAIENGYIYKEIAKSDSRFSVVKAVKTFDEEGEQTNELIRYCPEITVQVEADIDVHEMQYPYLDSLQYLYFDDRHRAYLTNRINVIPFDNNMYELNETDGDFSARIEVARCELSGIIGNLSDMYRVITSIEAGGFREIKNVNPQITQQMIDRNEITQCMPNYDWALTKLCASDPYENESFFNRHHHAGGMFLKSEMCYDLHGKLIPRYRATQLFNMQYCYSDMYKDRLLKLDHIGYDTWYIAGLPNPFENFVLAEFISPQGFYRTDHNGRIEYQSSASYFPIDQTIHMNGSLIEVTGFLASSALQLEYRKEIAKLDPQDRYARIKLDERFRHLQTDAQTKWENEQKKSIDLIIREWEKNNASIAVPKDEVKKTRWKDLIEFVDDRYTYDVKYLNQHGAHFGMVPAQAMREILENATDQDHFEIRVNDPMPRDRRLMQYEFPGNGETGNASAGAALPDSYGEHLDQTEESDFIAYHRTDAENADAWVNRHAYDRNNGEGTF